MEVAGIYSQFNRALLSFIQTKIKSKEDAEDILQNVFMKISSNLEKLSDEDKLPAWIFAITRNAIVDYYRGNASRKNVTPGDEIAHDMMDEDSSDPTKGLDQCVKTMIDLLPAEYKNIIIDSELNGTRQKDLAKKYNMPYPSMRSKVQRGRERLKQLFYNCCYIETDTHGNVLSAYSRNGCNGSCNPTDEPCL
jgi:RNA polymerase sigma-70 factor (ECF subfamily)